MEKRKYKAFLPSDKLVDLFYDNLIEPDEETKKFLEELVEFAKENGTYDPDIIHSARFKEDFGDDFIGLFATLAHRADYAGEKEVLIMENKKFSELLNLDLQYYLNLEGVKKEKWQEILDAAAEELYEFAKEDAEYPWGTVKIRDNNFIIEVVPGSGRFPSLKEVLKDNKWIVT